MVDTLKKIIAGIAKGMATCFIALLALPGLIVIYLFTAIRDFYISMDRFFLRSNSENRFFKKTSQLIASNHKAMPLADITDFDWDTLCILTPEHIRNLDKQTIPSFVPADIASNTFNPIKRTDNYALVFIKDRKILHVFNTLGEYFINTSTIANENCSAACIGTAGKITYAPYINGMMLTVEKN